MGRALPSSTSWSARLSSLAVVLSCETSMVSSSSSMRFAALARSSFSSVVSIVVIVCCSPAWCIGCVGFLTFAPFSFLFLAFCVMFFVCGDSLQVAVVASHCLGVFCLALCLILLL